MRLRKNAFILPAAALLLCLWIFAAPFLADGLVAEKAVDGPDVIVVLSGSADLGQRTKGAAGLYREKVAETVWLSDDGTKSSWVAEERRNPYFIELMIAALVKNGVPAEAIEVLPGIVDGTAAEAEIVIRTARERGFRKILIVTSEYHTRRSIWAFEREARGQGSDILIGISAAESDENYPNRYTWWLTPRGWKTVAGEYVKFGYYWLFN